MWHITLSFLSILKILAQAQLQPPASQQLVELIHSLFEVLIRHSVVLLQGSGCSLPLSLYFFIFSFFVFFFFLSLSLIFFFFFLSLSHSFFFLYIYAFIDRCAWCEVRFWPYFCHLDGKMTVRFWLKMTFFGPKMGPEPSRLLGPEPSRPNGPFHQMSCFAFSEAPIKIMFFREKHLKRGKVGKQTTLTSRIFEIGPLKKTLLLQLMPWTTKRDSISNNKQEAKQEKTTKQPKNESNMSFKNGMFEGIWKERSKTRSKGRSKGRKKY